MPGKEQEFLDFALKLAHAAEEQIMPFYRNHLVSFKSDGSEVTEADRSAERKLRELVAQQYPDHGLMGEEFGITPSSSPYQWVIDPLDGTSSFVLDSPIFGTLIALVEQNEPIVGVIHMPALGETTYAARGLGCWFKARDLPAKRIHVADSVSLDHATVSACGVHSSDLRAQGGETPYRLLEIIRGAGKFKFVGDCFQHALVCRGKIHAAIDTVMQPWDIAALVPCVEGAGGTASTLAGKRKDIIFGGSLLTSCDPALHQELLRRLQP